MLEIIKPKSLFNTQTIFRELKKDLKETGDEIEEDFERFTKTFELNPQLKREDTDEYTQVGTDNEVIKFLDEGTDPHTITGNPLLVFTVPSTPKTLPGVIDSGLGFEGDELVFTTEVEHPGTEPRNIAQTIADKIQPKFLIRVQDTLDKLC